MIERGDGRFAVEYHGEGYGWELLESYDNEREALSVMNNMVEAERRGRMRDIIVRVVREVAI